MSRRASGGPRGGASVWLVAALALLVWPGAAAARDDSAALALLEAHCWRCHGPDKHKADLRLDTAAGLAAVITPGEADASELFVRVSLPADDLDVMPPDGALSSNEIAVLRAWIDGGAALETVAARERDVAARSAAAARERAELSRGSGARVLPVGGGDGLAVDFGALGEAPQPSALAALGPVAARLLELSLAGCRVTPEALAALPALPRLERLHLERSGVGDEAAAALLGRTPALVYLNLHGTDAGPAVLAAAGELPALRRLVLHDTAVDAARLATFAAAHPEVAVTGDLSLPDDPFSVGRPRRLAVVPAGAPRLVLIEELALGHPRLVWERALQGLHGLAESARGTLLVQVSAHETVELDPRDGSELWRGAAQGSRDDVAGRGSAAADAAGGDTGVSGEGRAAAAEAGRAGSAAGAEGRDHGVDVGGADRAAAAEVGRGRAAADAVGGGDDRAADAEAGSAATIDPGVIDAETAGHAADADLAVVRGAAWRAGSPRLRCDGATIEVLDAAGNSLGRVRAADLGDPPPGRLTSAQLLLNGHLVCVDVDAAAERAQVLELDADGALVWSLRSAELFPDGVRAALVLDGGR